VVTNGGLCASRQSNLGAGRPVVALDPTRSGRCHLERKTCWQARVASLPVGAAPLARSAAFRCACQILATPFTT